jgi:hypothetical protein
VQLDNLADITPDKPFDSLALVEAQVNEESLHEAITFRIAASIGEPCKTASTELCKDSFVRATTTKPAKWFTESCGTCVEYTARFLVVTRGDEVRAGLADLSVFGKIDTPTEIAWTFLSAGQSAPLVRRVDGGFETLAVFSLDECEPSITRMLVSRIEPDGNEVPIRYHDIPPDPNTNPACP